jgi:hypothetical protein
VTARPSLADAVVWIVGEHTVAMPGSDDLRSSRVAPAPLRVAPLLDLVCITTFVLLGGERHGEITKDISWFLGVMWPLCVGWFGVALLTKLYTRVDGIWLALTITWIGGMAITQVLRGAFTNDPWIGIFTIVALTYLGLTTFGWRAVATLVRRRRTASFS